LTGVVVAVEHLRVAVLHTPRTEIVKGGGGIRHEDFATPTAMP
jgi:hypothetical protein